MSLKIKLNIDMINASMVHLRDISKSLIFLNIIIVGLIFIDLLLVSVSVGRSITNNLKLFLLPAYIIILISILVVEMVYFFKIDNKANLLPDKEIKKYVDFINDNKDKTIILIPCYNEEKSLLKAIEIGKKVGNVLVIDDGSSDNSIEIGLKEADYVIAHEINKGLATAIKNGIQFGLENDFEYFIIFDADCQYTSQDLSTISRVLANSDYDIILGSRFLGSIEKMSKFKNLGNRIFSKMISYQTKIHLSDTQTGLRAFKRNFAKNIKLRKEFTYTQQMIFEISKSNFKAKEIPIDFKIREYGESRLMTNALEYALRAWALNLQVLFEYNPMKMNLYMILIFWIGLGTFIFNITLESLFIAMIYGGTLIIFLIGINFSIIINNQIKNQDKYIYNVLK